MAYKSFSFAADYNVYSIERLSKSNSINVEYTRGYYKFNWGFFKYDEWYDVNSAKVIANEIAIARNFTQGLPPHLEESTTYQNLKIKIKYISDSAARARILGEAAVSTSAVEYANSLPDSGDIYLPPAEESTTREETITTAEMQNIFAYGMSFGASAKGYGLLSGIEISGEIEDLAYRGTASDIIPAANSILVANTANTIKWTYSQPYDAPQYYVSISAVYQDTGKSVTICNKQNITEQSYTIPANTLRDGTISLNIAVMPQAAADYYPADDSAWTAGTEVTYRVKTNPETSALTCDGKPMPTLTWTSSGQSAYQIRLGDYDTGVITGDAQSYQIPTLYEDGAYPAQIRVASNNGTWSEWSDTTYVQIANVPPSNYETEVYAKLYNNNVKLSCITYVQSGTSTTFEKYAFYRNNKIWHFGSGGEKIDNHANGRTTYFVRIITADGYYLQSNTVTKDIRPPCDLISDDDGNTYEYLYHTPSAKTQEITERNAITYQYYAGRSRPIVVSSGQTEKVMSCTYAFRSLDDAKKLTKYNGKEIMIKTTRGAIIRGVMDNLDVISGRITTVSFNVRETDAEE